ncbi:MAG: 30S ribosomal protein S27e [Thermoplasmatota archaeon]
MKRGLVPKPETEFITVKCKDCGNDQMVFERAATIVNCLVCGATVATPTGGKARIRGECEVVGRVRE